MQLGVSGSSGDAPAPAESGGNHVGVAGSTSAGQTSAGFSEEGDRGSSGNRWPREETLALLKIRSEMDAVFRDSSMKGPLWDEVSRKLAELGFKRSSKKCKEKFENVYKYHKRTKDGRVSKADSGKTYRFFDQLEALETHFSSSPAAAPPPPPPPVQSAPPPPVQSAAQLSVQLPPVQSAPPPVSVARTTSISSSDPTVTSTTANLPVTAPPTTNNTNLNLSTHHPPPPPPSNPTFFANFASLPSTTSSSSDEPSEKRPNRKRKWVDFFQRVMDEVIAKQEELQNKFLETLEKRERERYARDEAWRAQEMARINREHDLLAQERSIAAAKDAAVIAFLQKVSDQQIPNAAQFQQQLQNISVPPPPQPLPSPPRPPPQPLAQPPTNCLEKCKTENAGENVQSLVPALGVSPSRWPKAEIEALIRLRTELDNKYHESAPKGPLWEEISSAMRRIGYNRNAKRCKEKWENINKYYRKVKESNKKRPESSKTCPYFHQLDALYRQKANPNVGFVMHRENPTVPKLVQPEQQWPAMNQTTAMEVEQEHDSENTDLNHEDDDYDDDEEDDEANGYEIVTNKQGSSGVGTTSV